MIYGNNQASNSSIDAAKQYEMMTLAEQIDLMESIVNPCKIVDCKIKKAYADSSVKN